MDDPLVIIIMLIWNNYKDTIECLESLVKISYNNYYIIIVDNGSVDNSVKYIYDYLIQKNHNVQTINYDGHYNKEYKLSKTTLLKNNKNYGFSNGINITLDMICKLEYDYVLLINNDTKVEDCFLKNLIDVTEEDKQIGFACPLICDYNNKIWFAGEKFNFWMGRLYKRQYYGKPINDTDLPKIIYTEKLEGACLLIKKEVINIFNKLDPYYFIYWEITDLSYSRKLAYYKKVIVTNSIIHHKIGGTSRNIGYNYLYYYTKNKYYFMKKYAKSYQIATFMIYNFLYDYIMAIITYRNKNQLKTYFRGVKEGINILFSKF